MYLMPFILLCYISFMFMKCWESLNKAPFHKHYIDPSDNKVAWSLWLLENFFNFLIIDRLKWTWCRTPYIASSLFPLSNIYACNRRICKKKKYCAETWVYNFNATVNQKQKDFMAICCESGLRDMKRCQQPLGRLEMWSGREGKEGTNILLSSSSQQRWGGAMCLYLAAWARQAAASGHCLERRHVGSEIYHNSEAYCRLQGLIEMSERKLLSARGRRVRHHFSVSRNLYVQQKSLSTAVRE